MIVPIEPNDFNNLQINKQPLSRQLSIKLENMQFVGMTERWRLRRLAKIVLLKYNFTIIRQANLVPIVLRACVISFPDPAFNYSGKKPE